LNTGRIKKGNDYGWGVGRYATPENFPGKEIYQSCLYKNTGRKQRQDTEIPAEGIPGRRYPDLRKLLRE
jgi:hypothetical protein